jgi:ssDNA-binding Zn-finger/Zn-ribbon topoisomerase 1
MELPSDFKENTGVICHKCNKSEIVARVGRYGPFYVCSGGCRFILSARPTGNKCKMCGYLMTEGTKTIPERCGSKECLNHNPHKLNKP